MASDYYLPYTYGSTQGSKVTIGNAGQGANFVASDQTGLVKALAEFPNDATIEFLPNGTYTLTGEMLFTGNGMTFQIPPSVTFQLTGATFNSPIVAGGSTGTFSAMCMTGSLTNSRVVGGGPYMVSNPSAGSTHGVNGWLIGGGCSHVYQEGPIMTQTVPARFAVVVNGYCAPTISTLAYDGNVLDYKFRLIDAETCGSTAVSDGGMWKVVNGSSSGTTSDIYVSDSFCYDSQAFMFDLSNATDTISNGGVHDVFISNCYDSGNTTGAAAILVEQHGTGGFTGARINNVKTDGFTYGLQISGQNDIQVNNLTTSGAGTGGVIINPQASSTGALVAANHIGLSNLNILATPIGLELKTRSTASTVAATLAISNLSMVNINIDDAGAGVMSSGFTIVANATDLLSNVTWNGGSVKSSAATWATQYSASTNFTVPAGNTGLVSIQNVLGVAPAGFNVTTPSVPSGTGSTNAVANNQPFTIWIYHGSAVNAPHYIDQYGNDNAFGDNALGLLISPGAKVYYATTAPTSWKWSGY